MTNPFRVAVCPLRTAGKGCISERHQKAGLALPADGWPPVRPGDEYGALTGASRKIERVRKMRERSVGWRLVALAHGDTVRVRF